MRKIIYLFTIICCFTSCSEDKVSTFEDIYSRIYFDGKAEEFSFVTDFEAKEKVINIPVAISGLAVDREREFKAIAVLDTNTTAPETSYQVGVGIIKANEYKGLIPVTLKKIPRLDNEKLKLRIRLQENENFKYGDKFFLNYDIVFTNQLIAPANWSRWLHWYFGTYSTAWYKFIIEVTGRFDFPYWPNHPDKETWYWGNDGPLKAYQSLIRIKLQEYNLNHPNNPLRHDDGEQAGQIVEMP